MATPSKIHLTIDNSGIVTDKPLTNESAAKVSELLQKNHEEHHIFFNKEGFHNHIVHHLLSLYGLGASPSVLESQYNRNASYQYPPEPVEERIVQDMSDPSKFKKYLGDGKYYHDFLVFFQNEMEKNGWENTVKKYLFDGSEIAETIFVRMFAGFLHPIIHLGFGIEFQQPAIVAEALAQACVHDDWIKNALLPAEQAAKSQSKPSNKTLLQLLEEIAADKKLSTSAHWEDGNKIRDGVLKRAPEEMIKYASQWTVPEAELEKKTVEMIDTAIYFTSTAQHPPKQVKFDFYFMHCVNSSIFFPSFNAQPWIPTAAKIRLLEWKGRIDLVMYASRRCPRLLEDEIVNYDPRPADNAEVGWPGVYHRLFIFPDDGHAIKLARAVRNGELMSKKYDKEKWCKIHGDTWLKIGNMVVDSIEDTGDNWARSVGFEEAWKGFGDRPRREKL
ncbi:hypothetical protein F5884DRAFT_823493 [Xylogone sp. PMI_703]|nr:hypothetical protein F5884DRAFT_823493 [Xylogone sp. PMI_703]